MDYRIMAVMSYTQEEKDTPLKLYDETESIAAVINKLGYPSRQNIYTWIENGNIVKKENKAIAMISQSIEDILP